MVGSKKFSFWLVAARLPFYLLAITMLVPYYWMFIGAFKPVPELTKNPPTFFVQNPTLGNFYDSTPRLSGHVEGLFQRFKDAPFGFVTYFLNSVFISTTITFVSLLLASLVAYVIAKHKVPGRNIIFVLILASIMIPWQVMFIPNYLTMKNLEWINTYWALIIPALPKAFAVFFLRQYLLSLPDELLDAARIDGAGEIRIWWQIVLPLIQPALAAMAILSILNEWNNFVWPLIVAQDAEHATLPLALSLLNSTTSATTIGVLMAAALLTSIPTLVVFLLFQRQFIESVAFSGVKR